jgi:peptide/nickel transport system permease protein
MSFRNYLVQRFLYMVVTLILLSITIFFIIQLPPGDAVDRIVALRRATGDTVDPMEEQALRAQYGLDKPIVVQYVRWVSDFLRGNMGQSIYGQPVIQLFRERLPASMLISLMALVITYVIAIPIGIYSATHQYSLSDYLFTGISFLGLAIPDFLLALILLFVFFRFFGLSIGGLFSPGMVDQPWSLAKVMDLINHLWIPLIVIALSHTGGTVRVMRATLLDELGKQYVITARAKGVPWRRLLFKYPVRLAINPIVSTIGRVLPSLIAGETIVSIVLNLPTMGPLLFNALLAQDIQLAASTLMVQSTLAVIGVMLSDMLLVAVDPRIRFEKTA